MREKIKARTVQSGRGKRAGQFLRALFHRKIVLVGSIGTVFFVLIALFAPLVAPYDPNVIDKGAYLLGMSPLHPLGTDLYGRDLFSRLVFGARVSLLTGVTATLIAAAAGSLLGIVAAYYGGIVDKILLRACETLDAIPYIALTMALVAILGNGMLNMAVIMCSTCVPFFVRMMRASVLSILNSDYILAAKLSGQSEWKLWLKHILPNSVSPIIVSATQNVGNTIMMESGLSFLGIGISVPMASWGAIISEARPYLTTHPLYVLAPCACLAALIICLNLFGDGIRDALDPSLRGETA
jgi:ABC-type dipeptide/oligopeptide/nickel transport system permease subunit